MISLIASFLMTKTSLGPKAAKLASWGALALVAALLVGAALLWFNDTVDDAHKDGVKEGVTTERVEAQGKVIENVKAAKDAGDAVRRDGVSRDDCLQDSRIRENC